MQFIEVWTNFGLVLSPRHLESFNNDLILRDFTMCYSLIQTRSFSHAELTNRVEILPANLNN